MIPPPAYGNSAAETSGSIARAATGRIVSASASQDRVLFQRRTGARPLRRRRRRRRAAAARRGHAARQYSIRLAASLETISLRGVEQRRTGACRRHASRQRVAHRSGLGRARAAWRAADAAVAPDPHQRRRGRRISAHRLQRPEQRHGASSQPRRHHRRSGQPAGQARCRHLRPPGSHHAREPDGDPGDARQQRGARQAGGSGRAQALRASRTAC